MNGRPLFVAFIFVALAIARADNPALDPFQSLQPSDLSAQQAAVKNVFSRTDDPAILLHAADLLRTRCIDAAVNSLEYWGSDAGAQLQLRASAELLAHLLDRAQTLAQSQADAVAAAMRSATDSSQLDRWKRLNAAAQMAAEEKVDAQYAQLLAAEPEQKNVLARMAISAMKGWDLSDPLRRVAAHLQMAKILLAADQPADARAELLSLLNDPAITALAQQYQAHYFLCVCDLNQANFTLARADLANLLAWQEQQMPTNDSSARQGATAAAAILQYRINSAQADKTDSTSDKNKYNHSAIAALGNLVRQQPALKPAILHHLGERYAGATEIDHADPLILVALMQSGSAPDADARALASAGRAARAVVRRSTEFPTATVDYAAALSAAILDRGGQTADAAQAYLALVNRLRTRDVKTAGSALDRAIELFQTLPPASVDQNAYAETLTIAIAPPFNRQNLLYAQGQLLMQRGQYAAAAKVLRQIPNTDPHHIDAELGRIICIQQLMNANPQSSPAESARQIGALADDIATQVVKPSQVAAHSILMAAEACQAVHQPTQTLKRLQALPASCHGLPDENGLLDHSAELQIAALIELGRPLEAARVLASTEDQISAPVADLIKQLDADFDQARDRHDARQAALIASARVAVASSLVHHAAASHSTELHRDRLFYADSLRRAGELMTKGEVRRTELEQSLNIFQQLTATDESETSDPTPLLGEAGVQFDLENYSMARKIILPLLSTGRLGDGQPPADDAYWEATYELLASNAALAAQGKATAQEQAQTVAYLKRLYIQWGDQTGGKHWHASFEILRRRLAPGFTATSPTPPISP